MDDKDWREQFNAAAKEKGGYPAPPRGHGRYVGGHHP